MQLSNQEIVAIEAIFASKARDDQASLAMKPGPENQSTRDARQSSGMAFAFEWAQARPMILGVLKRLMEEQNVR